MYRCTIAKEYGKKQAIALVAPYNRASKHGFEHCGFTKYAQYINYRIWKGHIRSTLKYWTNNDERKHI